MLLAFFADSLKFLYVRDIRPADISSRYTSHLLFSAAFPDAALKSVRFCLG